MNTCFQNKSQLITFRSGGTKTMIHHILLNNKYKSSPALIQAVFHVDDWVREN